MLIRSPRSVRLGTTPLPDVELIVIEREAERIVEEWSDGGPTATFVDVPRISTRVRLERRVGAEENLIQPLFTPGWQETLWFSTGEQATDAGVAEIAIQSVIVAVKYRFDKDGIRQVLTLAGASTSPSEDSLGRTVGVRTPSA